MLFRRGVGTPSFRSPHIKSLNANAAGNQLLLAVPANHRVVLTYFEYGNCSAATIQVSIRFGSGGDLHHTNQLTAGSVVVRNLIGTELETREDIYIYTDVEESVRVTIHYAMEQMLGTAD
jgi:hypothetical protein